MYSKFYLKCIQFYSKCIQHSILNVFKNVILQNQNDKINWITGSLRKMCHGRLLGKGVGGLLRKEGVRGLHRSKG